MFGYRLKTRNTDTWSFFYAKIKYILKERGPKSQRGPPLYLKKNSKQRKIT